MSRIEGVKPGMELGRLTMPRKPANRGRYATLPLFILLLATPASAQNFAKASVTQVNLVDFKFNPSTIHLAAGKPVILRLANVAEQAHEFAAPQFFAAAAIRPGDVKSINKEGEVEVAPGARVEVALVPKAGTYHLQCNKPGHAAAGMHGSIVVK